MWSFEEVKQYFAMPFLELVYEAHRIHRQNFKPNEIQLCTLLSIKTGACPEDCAYCPQSAHFKTNLKVEKLMDLPEIVKACRQAKKGGATRFCMGAAWRSPSEKSLEKIEKAVEEEEKERMKKYYV